ncbi:hypothetical protein MSAN_00761600 [Mycena sanguinolenta]|uniref:Uncharacterized protein n=1 Tax=Mycena sanguinolenta TaxID=230812 RepID=A0A8H6Z2U9_9AGAR|nr:hypothetical protein MSAN_00761600 [Mycena sanguinolenta]
MKLSIPFSLSLAIQLLLGFAAVSAQEVCVNGECAVDGTQCEPDDPVGACADSQGDVVTSSTASSTTTVFITITASSSSTISVITLIPSPASSTSNSTKSQLVATANLNTSPTAPIPSSTITLLPSSSLAPGGADTLAGTSSATRRPFTPAIIGILIAALTLLCLATAAFLVCLRRRRARKNEGGAMIVLDPEAAPRAEAKEEGEQRIRTTDNVNRASLLGSAEGENIVTSSTMAEGRATSAGTVSFAQHFKLPSYSAQDYQNSKFPGSPVYTAQDGGAINVAQKEKFDSLAARAGKSGHGGMATYTNRAQDEGEDGPPEYEASESVSGCA